MKKYEINILASPNCKVFKSCTHTFDLTHLETQSTVWLVKVSLASKGTIRLKVNFLRKKILVHFFMLGLTAQVATSTKKGWMHKF